MLTTLCRFTNNLLFYILIILLLISNDFRTGSWGMFGYVLIVLLRFNDLEFFIIDRLNARKCRCTPQ